MPGKGTRRTRAMIDQDLAAIDKVEEYVVPIDVVDLNTLPFSFPHSLTEFLA